MPVYGMIFGIIGDVAYASTFLPLPFGLAMLMAFAFGRLLSLAFISFYHFFRVHGRTPLLQIATLFGIIAGTIVHVMIVVQTALRRSVPRGARGDLGAARDGLNAVQLGMDVSWDVYLSVATVLLGFVMLRHPRFGIIWGAVAILIGGGLLALNLATFPVPPGEAGSFDLGPAAGVFYLVVAIRVLTSLRWVDERTRAMTVG